MRQTRSSKKINKKGAIELGMNTIIIVVIGITLLVGALVWIRGTMEELSDTSKSAFQQADTALSDIYQGSSETLSLVPTQINVQKGEEEEIMLHFKNFEEYDFENVALEIEQAAASDADIRCDFTSNFEQTKILRKVASGDGKQVSIRVRAGAKSSLGTASCTIYADEADAEATVLVKVVS